MRVFFDVDGVLIDGWHARPERRVPWDRTIGENLGLDRSAFQRALFRPRADESEPLMVSCVRGDKDLREVLTSALPDIGWDGSPDTVLDYWFRKDSNVNRDVMAAVERLRAVDSVSPFIATNQEQGRASHLWNEPGFCDVFDDIFCSARFGVLKIDTRFYREVEALLGGTGTGPSIFFDDTEAVVESAREAGWNACLFDSEADILGHPDVNEALVRSETF